MNIISIFDRLTEKLDTSLDRNISKKLSRLYILALTAIALFAVVGQSFVQYKLSRQITASSVVNIAGRQRMLSQRITKDLLMMTNPATLNKKVYLEDLSNILPLWKDNHEGIKKGILPTDSQAFTKNTTIMDSMLTDVDPIFYSIYNNAVKIKEKINQETYLVDDTIKAALTIVLNNERRFLERQDKIVFQYDRESKERVQQLKLMEFCLLGFTILVLAFEGIFVFRPAVRNIIRTIEMLINEESKTKRINEELNQVNASLKKAETDLVHAEKEKFQLQVNEQRFRSGLLIEGQEEERKRISKELHDGLGQLLTTLKLTFENIKSESFSTEKEKMIFSDGKKLISDTINEVRNISFNLMPSVLSDFGIASALKSLCYQTASTNSVKKIIFEDIDWVPTRLDKNIEIGLYRVAQEALNNAIKYSESNEIIIELGLNEEIIELSIIDYGKGFQLNQIHNKPMLENHRNGISNMEERMEMIGGTVKIITGNGEGTQVQVRVPIKYPEENE
jgi:signal transduction histidine kinase